MSIWERPAKETDTFWIIVELQSSYKNCSARTECKNKKKTPGQLEWTDGQNISMGDLQRDKQV